MMIIIRPSHRPMLIYNIIFLYLLALLAGHRQYVKPISQAQLGLQANFQQVSNLSFKALKACIPQDPALTSVT